jgi:hypothetical protein
LFPIIRQILGLKIWGKLITSNLSFL